MCMQCVRAEHRARENRRSLEAQYARIRAAIRDASAQYRNRDSSDVGGQP